MTESPASTPPTEPSTPAEPPTVHTALPATMPGAQPPPTEPPTVLAAIPELPEPQADLSATPTVQAAIPEPQAPPTVLAAIPEPPEPQADQSEPQAEPPAIQSAPSAPPSQAAPAAPSAPEVSLVCPSCGATVWPGDNFCEVCRAELAPALFSGAKPKVPSQCPDCPGASVTPDGYCESCGRKVPVGSDHSELELELLAGITDRGLRHPRNEDAMALATTLAPGGEPVVLAIVCDGVSTSSRPDEASHRAAKTAMEVLLSGIRTSVDLELASTEAFMAARDALIAMAAEDPTTGNAPSATFVSAIITGRQVTVCWLGDSRAYWLDASDNAAARQLSLDDSVAQELIARGLLSESEALASPAGHVITGWLGADLRDAEPHVATFTPGRKGVVLLCSDGLWNYQPEATELAKMALPAAMTDPLGSAAELVRFALDAGGSDNVTVVLTPFPPADSSAAQVTAGEESDTRITVPRAAIAQGAVIQAAFPRTDGIDVDIPQIEENHADEPG